MNHLGNDKSYLRVWTERDSNYKEWRLVIVKSPQSPVISPSIEVPDSKTLGQRQPAAEVLGVAHGDEEDVAGAVVRHPQSRPRPELFITRRELRVLDHIGSAQ